MVTEPPRHARLAVLLAVALLSSGCTTIGYFAQAARGQIGVMRARQPIPALLAAPDTPRELRTRLELVTEMRDFASRELGLPDNASYRSYADLKRAYVVWNVVATPELSLEPRQWCFPVAGCVAYRGYFREEAARAFAAILAAQGDDVAVFGVAAYSTLGRFADPVLNTMTGYGTFELAGTIFHELAHQRLYVAGDSAFNEAFATTVEEAGLARYAASHGSQAALADWRRQKERGRELNAALAESRAELRALYRSGLAPDSQRERKRELFDALAARIRELEMLGGYRSGYHAYLDRSLNNAHLAAVATYRDKLPLFEHLLEQKGGDLTAFYAAADALAMERRAERRGPTRRFRGGPRPVP